MEKDLLHKYLHIFQMNQEELESYLSSFFIEQNINVINSTGEFIYVPGKIPVTFVAHMDTFFNNKIKEIVDHGFGLYSSPQGISGDDKNGIIAALEFYERLDLKPNILFTCDEEIGGIGVNKFVNNDISKNVFENTNIFIQFDRRGTNDFVTYSYDNFEICELLESVGFIHEEGTYSDVTTLMEFSGTAGVNISAAYFNEHTKKEIIDVKALGKNINRIEKILPQLYEKKREIDSNYLFNDFEEDYYISQEYFDKYLEEINSYRTRTNKKRKNLSKVGRNNNYEFQRTCRKTNIA